VSELRQISPEDLLGRDAVPPREDLMQRNITGKVVMVTGAGGSIGSELCRQIVQFAPAEIILFELSEFALYSITHELRETLSVNGREAIVRGVLGSVQNARRVRDVMKSFGVQTVYHAAAYKHVVLVEENVTEGIRNNVFGTLVLAEAAADLGVESFILISTDKAVRPTNFMGASKRMAELICQAFAQEDQVSRELVDRALQIANEPGRLRVLAKDGSLDPKPVEGLPRVDAQGHFKVQPRLGGLDIAAEALHDADLVLVDRVECGEAKQQRRDDGKRQRPARKLEIFQSLDDVVHLRRHAAPGALLLF
jgi:hypothetical protein